MGVRVKQANAVAHLGDGYRILIERSWPKGLSLKAANIHEWNKELAPSDSLRRWFRHKPEMFLEFKEAYLKELAQKNEQLERLRYLANAKQLTLVYGAGTPEANHAIILADLIKKMNYISEEYAQKMTSLQSMSQVHHKGMLICYRVREGLRLGIAPERIVLYLRWCWDSYLKIHIQEEEQQAFILLPPQDAMVEKARMHHQQLKAMFDRLQPQVEAIKELEALLNQHIRFEEWELYAHIQQLASLEELHNIRAYADDYFKDDWPDKFWEEAKLTSQMDSQNPHD